MCQVTQVHVPSTSRSLSHITGSSSSSQYLCAGGGKLQPVGRVVGNTGLWRGLVTGSAPFSVEIEDTNNQVSGRSSNHADVEAFPKHQHRRKSAECEAFQTLLAGVRDA